ncbi:uncharacterized protein LOC129780542 [Toxorhynchites rutilus septentrionalis]|uniref:uncharacterized protein LOC129780542 n=1 Tax=Toxorhynchites rutilus septentrionalis TaxID=329112 RepID=UPI0024786741|nr:uncharacterized protein LOC129780542 [Toxorhynchites rutilus septentrionalis]
MIECSELPIREIKRAELQWERRLHRKTGTDINRAGLGQMLQEVREVENISSQDIKGLASRIKRRKHADANDLIKLSYGFQQSAENISEFVRITGAINVIVKEFTGNDSDLQQLAGECLCNLTLGEEVCCERVVTFAGTYLITFLENLNNRVLNNICIWTLQNIIASGPKAMKAIHSKGIVASLQRLLAEAPDSELLDEVLLTLELMLDYEDSCLSKAFILTRMLPEVLTKPCRLNGLKLLYKCLKLTNFETLDNHIAQLVVDRCVENLVPVAEKKDPSSYHVTIILCVRILANLIALSESCLEKLINECVNGRISFCDLFQFCSNDGQDRVCREMLWLFGNIYKSASKQQMNRFLEHDNFTKNLAVPRVLLLD